MRIGFCFRLSEHPQRLPNAGHREYEAVTAALKGKTAKTLRMLLAESNAVQDVKGHTELISQTVCYSGVPRVA